MKLHLNKVRRSGDCLPSPLSEVSFRSVRGSGERVVYSNWMWQRQNVWSVRVTPQLVNFPFFTLAVGYWIVNSLDREPLRMIFYRNFFFFYFFSFFASGDLRFFSLKEADLSGDPNSHWSRSFMELFRRWFYAGFEWEDERGWRDGCFWTSFEFRSNSRVFRGLVFESIYRECFLGFNKEILFVIVMGVFGEYLVSLFLKWSG